VTSATLIATGALYILMPKSFLPLQDTGLITVVFKADPDVSFAQISHLQSFAVTTIKKIPEIADIVSVAGTGSLNPTPNVASLTIALVPHDKRRRTAAAIAAEIQASLSALPGIIAFAKPVQDVQIATRSSFSQFQYTLVGSDGAEVRRWGTGLLAQLRTDAEFRNVNSIEEDEGLATNIVVDRMSCGQFGVSLQAISDVLNDAFAQRQISTIYGQANQYRVVLEADPRYRTDPSMLGSLRLPGSGGAQVPLMTVARLERVSAPLAISHQEQFPSFTVSFDLASGQSLGEAVAAIGQAAAKIEMPSSVIGSFSGRLQNFDPRSQVSLG
jgi:multidrug efflux pump